MVGGLGAPAPWGGARAATALSPPKEFHGPKNAQGESWRVRKSRKEGAAELFALGSGGSKPTHDRDSAFRRIRAENSRHGAGLMGGGRLLALCGAV